MNSSLSQSHTLGRLSILLGAAMLSALFLLLSVSALWAQSDGISRTVTADEVNLVASELWCPLCSGVRLDSCELQACEQMREEIAIKLEAGEDTDAIKEYFYARYGPQVLGAPKREGWGILVWILPMLVLLAAGVVLFLRARQMIASPQRAASVAEVKGAPPKQSDPYDAQLDQELANFDR